MCSDFVNFIPNCRRRSLLHSHEYQRCFSYQKSFDTFTEHHTDDRALHNVPSKTESIFCVMKYFYSLWHLNSGMMGGFDFNNQHVHHPSPADSDNFIGEHISIRPIKIIHLHLGGIHRKMVVIIYHYYFKRVITLLSRPMTDVVLKCDDCEHLGIKVNVQTQMFVWEDKFESVNQHER